MPEEQPRYPRSGTMGSSRRNLGVTATYYGNELRRRPAVTRYSDDSDDGTLLPAPDPPSPPQAHPFGNSLGTHDGEILLAPHVVELRPQARSVPADKCTTSTSPPQSPEEPRRQSTRPRDLATELRDAEEAAERRAEMEVIYPQVPQHSPRARERRCERHELPRKRPLPRPQQNKQPPSPPILVNPPSNDPSTPQARRLVPRHLSGHLTATRNIVRSLLLAVLATLCLIIWLLYSLLTPWYCATLLQPSPHPPPGLIALPPLLPGLDPSASLCLHRRLPSMIDAARSRFESVGQRCGLDLPVVQQADNVLRWLDVVARRENQTRELYRAEVAAMIQLQADLDAAAEVALTYKSGPCAALGTKRLKQLRGEAECLRQRIGVVLRGLEALGPTACDMHEGEEEAGLLGRISEEVASLDRARQTMCRGQEGRREEYWRASREAQAVVEWGDASRAVVLACEGLEDGLQGWRRYQAWKGNGRREGGLEQGVLGAMAETERDVHEMMRKVDAVIQKLEGCGWGCWLGNIMRRRL